MNNKTFDIILYILSLISFIPQVFILIYRLILGKETAARIVERFGVGGAPKQKDLIWIHGASVGETYMALSLVDMILDVHKSYNFLITSGTITSASLAAKKIEDYNLIYKRQVLTHQFLPIDNYLTAKKFLNYWQPCLCIFIESELWPNIITVASKKIPILLVNAKISERSFKKWINFKSIIQNIGNKFSATLAQSNEDYKRFKELGFKNVKLIGNIKYSQKDPIVIDESLFQELSNSTTGREIIFAASTHAGEDEIIINIYKSLKSHFQNLLLIIAPRHPERLAEILEIAKSKCLECRIRSNNEPIINKTDIYILDTIGEMCHVFKLRPLTFMGGSFTIGGHNILEPARYQSPIIFGPNMINFLEISNEFLQNNASIQAKDQNDLASKIQELLAKFYTEDNGSSVKKMIEAASSIIDSKESIGREYIIEILKHMRT